MTAGGRTLASLEASFGKMPWNEGLVRAGVKRSQREERASKQVVSSSAAMKAVFLPWAASEYVVAHVRKGSIESIEDVGDDRNKTSAIDVLFGEIFRKLADGDLEGAKAGLVQLKASLEFSTGRQSRSKGGKGLAACPNSQSLSQRVSLSVSD